MRRCVTAAVAEAAPDLPAAAAVPPAAADPAPGTADLRRRRRVRPSCSISASSSLRREVPVKLEKIHCTHTFPSMARDEQLENSVRAHIYTHTHAHTPSRTHSVSKEANHVTQVQVPGCTSELRTCQVRPQFGPKQLRLRVPQPETPRTLKLHA